jgi:alpha-N-arabinofuranosidase
VPVVDSVVTHEPNTGELSVFSVNRSTRESVQLGIDLRAFPGYQLAGHLTLEDENHRATNSEQEPNRVAPRKADVEFGPGRADVRLSPISWSLLRMVRRP